VTPHEQAAALVEAMGELGYAVAVTTPEGAVLHANDAWTDLTGRDLPVEIGRSPMVFDGDPVLLAVAHDVADRQRDELIRLHRTMIDTIPIGMAIWRADDLDDRTSFVLVAANIAWAASIGVARGRSMGQTMAELMPAAMLTALPDVYLDVIRRDEPRSLEDFVLPFPTGDLIVDVRAVPLPGNCVGVALEDVTERVQGISARRQQLRRIVTVEEDTRRRLAEELHDDPIQVLTAMNLRLGLLRRQADLGATLDFDTVEELAGTSIESLRRIMFDLLPPGLAAGSLTDAVQAQASQLRLDATVDVQVHVDEIAGASPEVLAASYRIVQEALANVRRHAEARSVTIDVRTTDSHEIEIEVVDDGIGVPAAGDDDQPGHIGLRSMRERAQGLGGWCIVESAGERGTRVRARLPLSDPGRG
jgi:signal transduction histidine kinase